MNAPLSYEEYQSRKWIPGLDGVRALCALAVVAGHMHTDYWHWVNGNRGVTIFFLLSGFLITMLALREEQKTGSLSLTAFYIRRSFRIFPLYYFTLALYCVLVYVIGLRSPQGNVALFGQTMWAYILYLQEFVVLDPMRPSAFFSQSWTLGIEEKFYLVWPLIGFVALAAHKRYRVTATIAFTVAAAVIGLIDQQGWGRYLHHYFYILLGCLLAELLHKRASFDSLKRFGQPGMVYLTSAALMLIHFGWPLLMGPPEAKSYDTIPYVIYKYVYGVATFFFLTSLIVGRNTLVHRSLEIPPLPLLGQLSYGIYLVHRLAINASDRMLPFKSNVWWQTAAHMLVTTAISFVMAWILSIVIEKPCIELGRRLSKRFLEKPSEIGLPLPVSVQGPV
jgi:peptidoglycan/LPS O-acetylase OafA/YrhL